MSKRHILARGFCFPNCFKKNNLTLKKLIIQSDWTNKALKKMQLNRLFACHRLYSNLNNTNVIKHIFRIFMRRYFNIFFHEKI